ncbi:unnamed protein product [Knipowitschia caucasica]
MSCCVKLCHNTLTPVGPDGTRKVNMYLFPKEPKLQQLWLKATRRWDRLHMGPVKYLRICSEHFITGVFSKDPEHPDYVPSIFSFNMNRDYARINQKVQRYNRMGKRTEVPGRPFVPVPAPRRQPCDFSKKKVKDEQPQGEGSQEAGPVAQEAGPVAQGVGSVAQGAWPVCPIGQRLPGPLLIMNNGQKHQRPIGLFTQGGGPVQVAGPITYRWPVRGVGPVQVFVGHGQGVVNIPVGLLPPGARVLQGPTVTQGPVVKQWSRIEPKHTFIAPRPPSVQAIMVAQGPVVAPQGPLVAPQGPLVAPQGPLVAQEPRLKRKEPEGRRAPTPEPVTECPVLTQWPLPNEAPPVGPRCVTASLSSELDEILAARPNTKMMILLFNDLPDPPPGIIKLDHCYSLSEKFAPKKRLSKDCVGSSSEPCDKTLEPLKDCSDKPETNDNVGSSGSHGDESTRPPKDRPSKLHTKGRVGSSGSHGDESPRRPKDRPRNLHTNDRVGSSGPHGDESPRPPKDRTSNLHTNDPVGSSGSHGDDSPRPPKDRPRNLHTNDREGSSGSHGDESPRPPKDRTSNLHTSHSDDESRQPPKNRPNKFHTYAAAEITSLRSVVCPVCQNMCLDMASFLTHVKRHITQGRRCDVCDLKLKSSWQLEQHMRIHTGEKPFCCPICARRFRVKKSMKQHLRRHSLPVFSCNQCGKTFKKEICLTVHQGQFHPLQPPEEPRPALKKKFDCGACGKVFNTEHRLGIHMTVHTGERPHECPDCHKRFRTRPKMLEHRKLHSRTRNHPCGFCDKSFYSNSQKLVHEASAHTGKTVECPECGKLFATKSKLNFHSRRHARDKPYRCSVCQQLFESCELAHAHLQSHKQEREASGEGADGSMSVQYLGPQFLCTECGKSFYQKINLSNHMLMHSDERPFACSLCTLKFKTKATLSIHTMLHTNERPHGCTLCPKRFRTKGTLVKHEKFHSGEKPFSCGMCSARFRTSTSLNKHVLSHSRERPHACLSCARKYKTLCALHDHMKVAHGAGDHCCAVCAKAFMSEAGLHRHMARAGHVGGAKVEEGVATANRAGTEALDLETLQAAEAIVKVVKMPSVE